VGAADGAPTNAVHCFLGTLEKALREEQPDYVVVVFEARVSMISTDEDLMQLVDVRVTLLDGIKDRRFGPAEVEERFGVPPAELLDLRSLVGEPSDNIPGVKGIGEERAAALISTWGSRDILIDHAEEVEAKRTRTA